MICHTNDEWLRRVSWLHTLYSCSPRRVYLYVWIRRGFCSWCLLRYIWIVSVSVYCHYVIYSASEEAGELTQNYGYYVAIDFIWWHHHHNAEQLNYSSAANIHYCAGRAGGRAYWTSLYLLYTTAAAATTNIIVLCCTVLCCADGVRVCFYHVLPDDVLYNDNR